jgi:pyruvate/2-oxoglutarate dehydrogenase complex dihydrolipoamide dehydrogenase (E3) component
VLAWRNFMVSAYDDAGQVAWARDKGIEVLRGSGRLTGPRVVAVDDTPYTADHVVIATGADPVIPPIPGLADLPGVWTNRHVTGLTTIPPRLIVLGGGATGVEMSQALARMGCGVTVVERAGHLLPREPREIGEAVAAGLSRDGVDVRLGTPVEHGALDGGEYVVALGDGTQLRAERLLVAAGRRPRVDSIGLETVGVAADGEGLAVDARLSLGPGLWAIGDVTGFSQLTHVGEYQGRVVADNILGRPRTARYDAVPRVVYCDPQVASVGATDGPFTSTVPLSGMARTSTYTRAYDSQPGFLTLVSDGRVVTGGCAVGPEAGEWLQQVTLAVHARVPLPVLLDVIQPFPTFSESILQALRDLDRKVGSDRAPVVAAASRASVGVTPS